MKKVLSVLLVMTMCFLASCSNTVTTSSEEISSADTSSTVLESVVLGKVVSKNKTATASISADTMPAKHLTDGDVSTVWATGICDEDVSAYVKIDLGENFDITGVKINWGVSSAKTYKIETCRGNYDYQTAFESVDNSSDAAFSTTARYVKITFNGADKNFASVAGITVKEIEIFGSVSEDKTMGNEKAWDSDYIIDTKKQEEAKERYNGLEKLQLTRVANDTYDYLGVNHERINYLRQNAFDGFDMYQLGDKDGLVISDITINAGLGEEVVIAQLSDLHMSTINDKDREENNSSLLYTAEKYKTWAIEWIEKELAYAEIADRVVLTGDTISYLSHGNIEAMYEYIWNKYPYHIITSGNHDSTQVMGGVPELLTDAERMAWINDVWKHNYEYVSTVVKDKVMIIAVDNATQFEDGIYSFAVGTAQKMKTDLEIAKEKGYAVLLFAHVPLYTANPDETDVLCHYVGDWQNRNDAGQKRYTYDFSINKITPTGKNSSDKEGRPLCGTPEMKEDGENAKVFALINEYSTTIKGVFTGHKHGAYYTEILCEDGTKIPQYTMNGGFYTFGTVTKITVK